jgi:hypothetical protein
MDVVVGGSRPRRNVTDDADGPRTGTSKLLRSTGSTGVTQCPPTNTSARPATSVSRPSRSSLTRLSRPAPNVEANFAKSSLPSGSSSRVRASIRTTVEAPPSPRPPLPARPRRRRQRPPTPVLRPPLHLRRRQHRRRRRPLRPTKCPILRYFQSRRSGRRHCRATIPGRCRRRSHRATCAAALMPR